MELENSIKILRSDAKVKEAVNTRDTTRRRVNTEQNENTCSNSDRGMEGCRNQMKNIEIENLKTRMTVMEQNVTAQRFHVYQNYPPPGFNTHPLQFARITSPIWASNVYIHAPCRPAAYEPIYPLQAATCRDPLHLQCTLQDLRYTLVFSHMWQPRQ